MRPQHEAELEATGDRRVDVGAPVARTSRLLALEPFAPMANHLANVVTGPVVLFVGPLLPVQRVDLLVESFHVLVSHLVSDANLVLTGPMPALAHRHAIERQLRTLNLSKVWMAGPVRDDELVAMLRRADVLATMSEDDGFDATVLDAFAFDVPVVARRFGSRSDLVRGAGLLLEPDDGPATAAEAMYEVVCNRHLRERLVERGRQRWVTFDRSDAIGHHMDLSTADG